MTDKDPYSIGFRPSDGGVNTNGITKSLPPMLKDRRHSKTMTKYGNNIKTILTNSTDNHFDCVLLLVKVKKKGNSSLCIFYDIFC